MCVFEVYCVFQVYCLYVFEANRLCISGVLPVCLRCTVYFRYTVHVCLRRTVCVFQVYCLCVFEVYCLCISGLLSMGV